MNTFFIRREKKNFRNWKMGWLINLCVMPEVKWIFEMSHAILYQPCSMILEIQFETFFAFKFPQLPSISKKSRKSMLKLLGLKRKATHFKSLISIDVSTFPFLNFFSFYWRKEQIPGFLFAFILLFLFYQIFFAVLL